jgi:hypothetical protein
VELTAALVVLGQAIGTVGLGWLYFRRWQVTRPPIGVFNLTDVLFMLGGIVLIPLLYLALPNWSVAGLLALGALSALYFALEPILRSRFTRWLLVILAAAGEAAALGRFGPTSTGAFVVNNAVLVVGVVGVANLWAQSGMKARDAAILGGALAVYDLVATSSLPLMSDLYDRVVRMPFAPIVGWADGQDGGWVAIGLGDLLVTTVFPPVMRKAYGRAAGWAALVIGSALIAAVFALGALARISIFPVMAVLGPAMVLQYAWWARRRGQERTTRQYLEAEPPRGGSPTRPIWRIAPPAARRPCVEGRSTQPAHRSDVAPRVIRPVAVVEIMAELAPSAPRRRSNLE